MVAIGFVQLQRAWPIKDIAGVADFGRCIVLATIRNVAYRSAGQLLGANATAAALAAQNEALNNSISDKVTKWVKETYQDPLGDLARWGKQFLGMLPGQTPLAEAYPLVEARKVAIRLLRAGRS
ncbi:hypothetical protein K6V92_00300 [Cupriavidus respiraculi]|uniref:hypothetical protein n=1 Tax=Cupriavidus respiraculi TaxID=195930 RepID=UPI001C95CA8C|nr:hypothetical protein [Cupriavidus respiraculi]MBY4945065.1 hypothetical protein [Cupriavidus respiraculi]